MFISVISMAYLTLKAFIEYFQCVRHWKGWMQTQIRYEPYVQRSYKLEIMVMGHIYRMLCTLQDTFRECHNAIDHGYYSFNIFVVVVECPEWIRKWELREVK